MTCPTCHREIPESKNHIPLLACPYCLADKSYRAVLDAQRPLIVQIVKSDRALTLTKPAEESRWHMAFSTHPQAWCGRELNTRWKKKQQPYSRIDFQFVCESCQRVFLNVAEGRPTEVA